VRKSELATKTLESLRVAFPQAGCTLDFDTPERLAIRGILSAQCKDERVNEVAANLFDKYPEMTDLFEASSKNIEEMIKPCGLHKSKAGYIKDFTDKFLHEWGGRVPDSPEELMRCQGVGRKIANLIVGEIYKIPAVVVDTHMKRVMYRIGITNEKDPIKVEKDICKVFPEDSWIALGHRAVELGREYCIARAPQCDICPLTSFCMKRTGRER